MQRPFKIIALTRDPKVMFNQGTDLMGPINEFGCTYLNIPATRPKESKTLVEYIAIIIV
jgi:hypothetical protein